VNPLSSCPIDAAHDPPLAYAVLEDIIVGVSRAAVAWTAVGASGLAHAASARLLATDSYDVWATLVQEGRRISLRRQAGTAGLVAVTAGQLWIITESSSAPIVATAPAGETRRLAAGFDCDIVNPGPFDASAIFVFSPPATTSPAGGSSERSAAAGARLSHPARRPDAPPFANPATPIKLGSTR
jgi:hypothetical protein